MSDDTRPVIPEHILANPAWQRIWAKLLSITPEAEAAIAAERANRSGHSHFDHSYTPSSVAASGCLPAAGRHLRASDSAGGRAHPAPDRALGGDAAVTAGESRQMGAAVRSTPLHSTLTAVPADGINSARNT